MNYYVSIREIGKPQTLESGVCTQDEVQNWCDRAKAMAKQLKARTTIAFRPREITFDFDPSDSEVATVSEEIKRHPYKPPDKPSDPAADALECGS